MLFLQHDFYSNFEGINKSKDKPLMKELIFSEIARLIALHKKELLQNIQDLGYKLPNTKDTTVVDFIFERAGKDQKLSDMLAAMIKKYNAEGKSNADGYKDASGKCVELTKKQIKAGFKTDCNTATNITTNTKSYSNGEGTDVDWGGIASGLGATIGGIFNYAGQVKQSKADVKTAEANRDAAKEQAELLLQIETIKASQPKAAIGTMGWVAIGVGVAALLTVVLVLALKKPKVILQPQVQQ